MSMEADIAEMKADLKHAVSLMAKHDKSLYGEDGGNGLVSHVHRHNELEGKVTRLVAAIVTLALANIGTLGKLIWTGITSQNK